MRKNLSPTIEVFELPKNRSRPVLPQAEIKLIEKAQHHLQKEFDLLLASDELLLSWILRMKQLKLRAVVFGGWARDRLVEMIDGKECPSRDIDFVVDGNISVAQVLPEDAILNPFGGFGAKASSIHVDAWNLRDTFLIRRYELPISFEQLPFTADYTINAIVFKPLQLFPDSSVIDSGALHSIQNAYLDFAADEVAHPQIQAARAVILATRLQLTPSITVCKFIKTVCNSQLALQAVTKGVLLYAPPPWKERAIALLTSIVNE